MIRKLVIFTLLATVSTTLFVEQEAFALTHFDVSEPHTELLYAVNVGTTKYVVHFNVCAGQKIIELPEILIKSDLETVQVTSTKSISPYTCHSYESTVNAKYQNTIKITLI